MQKVVYLIVIHGFLTLQNSVLCCQEDICVTCSGNSQNCDKCKDGYRLQDGFCFACPEKCEQCTNATYCSKCKANYYTVGSCYLLCPKTCDESGCEDKVGHCYGCPNGFYGPYCQYECNLCIDGSCSLRNCTKGCIDGYTDELGQCKKCPNNCKMCQNWTVCLECRKGFYTFNYITDNGNNVSICNSCPSACEECNSDADCTKCKPGKYGQYCTYNCSGSNCYRCSETAGVSKCTECIAGYKLDGNACILDTQCSQNCDHNGCDENGHCIGECKDGWTGKTCSSQCASRCQRCNQSDFKMCTMCTDDSYTTSCNVMCSSQCSRLSGKETCRLNGGYCLNGCKDGYWGSNCSNVCYEGCNSVRCNQDDGYCDTCSRSHYGADCQHTCSENCRDNGTEGHICKKSDGKCELGCIDGYQGDNCSGNTTASYENTKPSEVERDEGMADKVMEKDRSKDNVLIGAGAGGGVIVVSAAVCLIVFILVRRQRRKDEAMGSEVDGEENLQTVQTDADNVYAKPNKPTQKQGQDYINAQPDKPKRRLHHSKKEISEPHKVYDNDIIDLDTEKDADRVILDDHTESGDVVTQETDIDSVILENLDDEPKSVIVTDMNIPTSETYYNIDGLVRSRVQIRKLLEYFKNKSDYDTEFEKLPKGLTRTCNEALKPNNRAKNRYNGIYAYDATRVVLQSKSFINANYVEGYSQSQIAYIASLGPTKVTMNNFETFWEMIWQERTHRIIMLTKLKEAEKMKCEQYWPEQGSRTGFGVFTVSCTVVRVYSDFVVRELTIEKMSEIRNITQYHYTAWPDKTVPSTVASLVEFRDKVEQEHSPVTGPMVVHCSAGIGRTGTYIALDILIREGREEESVDIFGCVNALRGQRVNLVQNVEQYVFLHRCVLYALTCDPQSLPVTAVPHIMTDEKISIQFQAFMDMHLPGNIDVRLMSKVKGRKENRKGADIPGEESRVLLRLTKHDYINAVYVNGYIKRDKFIVAQTPLPNTVEDFVSMLYQERCACVVSLDRENIRDKTIETYIPPANKVSTFGHFQVESSSSDSRKDFTIRELKISRIGSPSAKELKVRHYQFKGWNDSKNVPDNIQPFLNIVVDVENTTNRQQTDKPVVIHCVTGAERSGLFCVVSILQEKYDAEKELSVLNTVCQVRSRRRSAVQNEEQLRFCYDCVTEMSEMLGTNTYYNTSNV